MNTVTAKDLADLYSGLEALLASHPDSVFEPDSLSEPAGGGDASPVRGVLAAGQVAAQGDLLFVPVERAPHWAQHLGEITLVGDGNGHRLTPSGLTRWATSGSDPQVIGVFEVLSGTATVDQPRQVQGSTVHTPLVFGVGAWRVHRQVSRVAPRLTRRRLD